MLRILRERAGLSREQLVARLGNRISLSTWFRWETDPKEPAMTRQDWQDFCSAVGIPFEDLPPSLTQMDTRQALLERIPLSRTGTALPSQFASLFALRRQAGLTQKQLAEALSDRFRAMGNTKKVSKANISSWEVHGRQPRFSFDELTQMADVLGCTLPELTVAILLGASKKS